MGIRKHTFIFICLLAVVVSQAEIINVDDDGPADFDNIQDAINSSNYGDTIVVQPGTYNENINFNNQAITLTSTDPDDPNIVESTVITYNEGYFRVSFEFDEDSNSVITGFTIEGAGVRCYGTSPVISKNIIRDATRIGIYGENDAAPIISDNRIESCNWRGIDHCHGPITNNIILGNNGSGINACNGPIINNTISENSSYYSTYGGGLTQCNGKIEGNIISYNYTLGKGGGCLECGGNIKNNIIVGNRSSISGGGLGNCYGEINNNIIAGNVSGSGGGLFGCFGIIYNNTIIGNIAHSTGGAINQCNEIFNNIIAFNEANNVGGINSESFNYNNVFWLNTGGNFGSGARAGPGDTISNPHFAVNGYWETNETADESDDYWVEGDYHLKSKVGRWDPINQQWVVDNTHSICIDSGDPNTALIAELWPHGNRVNVGVYGNTAQASMSMSDEGNIADLNYDGWVDYNDMEIQTKKWLFNEAPLSPDMNRDGVVNLTDYSILIANWQERPPKLPEPQPPTPDPMTWSVEPYAISTSAISMTAATASSTDDSGVEYYFNCDTPGGHDSGWQDGLNYTDTGLSDDTEYAYRVKARNKGNQLETELSPSSSATTIAEDRTPPTPNPAQWETKPYKPYETAPATIRMVAVTASDPSGVEYYFQCTSHSQYSSGWQNSSTYEVSSLPDNIYTFTVKVRDKSKHQNTTNPSDEATIDLQPPTPNPMQWATGGEPKEVEKEGSSTTRYWAEMTAAEASDPSGGVEYYFECVDESGFDSEWQSSTFYSVRIGRSLQALEFRVKARDKDKNETAYSSKVPAL